MHVRIKSIMFETQVPRTGEKIRWIKTEVSFSGVAEIAEHHSGPFVKRVPTPFWSALHYMVSAPTFFLLAASICAPAALPKTGLTQTPGDAPIGTRSKGRRRGP